MKINRVLIISLIFCLLIGCGQTTSVKPNSSNDADTSIETLIDDISNSVPKYRNHVGYIIEYDE